MTYKSLSVAEALLQAEMIEATLGAIFSTAPIAVMKMGGRDGLARICEMSCIGPIPKLDYAAWEAMSQEYEDSRYGDRW